MHEHWLTQFCLVLILTTVACDEGSNRTFDHLLFVRQEAGDKAFTIEPAGSLDAVTIVVTHWQFRDTLVQFRCVRDANSSGLFDSLFAALNGEIRITGVFHQSTLPTGTWAYLYMIRNGEQFQITNADLRNQLLPFEDLVKVHFASTQ